MSSTYSTSLRIQLIDTGTEDEAWGIPTDNNLGTIIEQAITGVESVSLTGVSTYTLSASNAVADQSRNAVLIFTGTPTANCNVIAPSVNKIYIVKNGTSGGYTVNIKTSSGNAVVIAANTTQLVYCNAVDFISAVNINNVIGNLTVTGNVTVSGNVTVNTTVGKISNPSGNLTLTSTGNTVNFSPTTGAFIPPIGNTAQRPATPVNGMSRWNSQFGYYEIWNGSLWQQVTGAISVQYVVVAGGGAGGGHDPGGGQYGGGGGAGGLVTSSFQSSGAASYTVTVGAGGPQGPDGSPVQSGSNSSVIGDTLTAIAVGGGGGGNGRGGGTANLNGGSGGGASSASAAYGSGTTGQGNSGATSGNGGGGGGAGVAASGSTGGNGIVNPITGSTSGQLNGTTYYLAGGGGGGSYGTAGLGGGGFGGYPGSFNQGGSGAANTGGGAGGSGGDGGGQQLPSPGGSGIVIFTYQAAVQKATGGTVTSYSSGGYTYWIHTFTSSGTFTTTQELIMPSTYSTSLKLELIGNGEQTGTWGQTTNNNLGTLIEQAITGVGQLTLVGDTVLTNYNGLPDESRNAVLTFSGSLAAPANVVTPAVEKTYIVTNNSGANVTIKTASGTGVTVANGLSALIYCDGTDFYTAVNVNNVIGNLTVSGNEVIGGAVYLGNSTVSGAAGNLTMTANSSVIDMSTNTGAFIPPTGTTANRPASPTVGMSRWNTTLGQYEIWSGLAWQVIASGAYNTDYLVIAGGGGTGAYGGGGAGGYLTGTTSVTPTTSYSIVVGSGGGAGIPGVTSGSQGANSSALGFVAVGGGNSGGNGGSGGGSAGGAGGSGTLGQGNAGGAGTDGNSCGGGGGAGAAGSPSPTTNFGGAGGAGLSSSITGTAVTRAGGGGGRGSSGGGAGGSGGGGAGGNGGYGGSGTTNTGSGGGGNAGAGGSGVVILAYQSTTQRATGGTVTSYTSGGFTYWVHTFTSSGTFVA